jgi:hypothetical protein
MEETPEAHGVALRWLAGVDRERQKYSCVGRLVLGVWAVIK